MSSEVYYPVHFEGASPSPGASEYLRDSSVRLLADFFQAKGLKGLEREDRQEVWYQDWIDYQARHGLYASVLSPQRYSTRGHQFDLRRLTRFLEVFSYFSPAHAYSLHVSFLGLFPILMSSNEPLKQEAVARLESGGLFAFGVTERAHGADLFANEFAVTEQSAGGWLGHGEKYYIGNANAACLVSILARKGAAAGNTARRAPFVFFAIRPTEAPAFQNVRKIRTLGIRSAFVGAFEVKDHPFPQSDLISQGREAWDAVLDTVTFGKFFLGFGAVGICEHALAEALAHLRSRILYGKPVSEMPHIRLATTFAFARLLAMKLYAYRALDYLETSSAAERRYLLFNAVQKAKVSTEGVKVMALLSECIGARGFESDTYFESALRNAQMIPALEGSTHINFAMTIQFIEGYFAGTRAAAPAPQAGGLREEGPGENPYWLEINDRNARTVRFGRFLEAYAPLRAVANVRLFVKQIKAFAQLTAGGLSAANPSGDGGAAIALGKCFSTIAYAQLVAEACQIANVAASTVSVIFHALIEDLREESLGLAALYPSASSQRALLRRVVRVPATAASDFEAVAAFVAARE